MYIHGTFLSAKGEEVAVHIVTLNDRTVELEIGTQQADIYFTDDPVEIHSEVSNTFDVLLRQSAKVHLLCGNLIPDFFCTSCTDAVVNIYKGTQCVFAGFIEPMTFSQPYNDRWDELELNCVDVLSALQYSRYKNVGALGVNYEAIRANATQRRFVDIIREMIGGITRNLDTTGARTINLWYDGSIATDELALNKYSVFWAMSISEALFLEDKENQVWQQDKILGELLRFLNLHIIQEGFDFYVFSWSTLRNTAASIQWRDLYNSTPKAITPQRVTLSLDNAVDTDTSISIGEVFNQLQLTVSVRELENFIESPLDDKDLFSDYVSKQKYLTEFAVDGEFNPIIAPVFWYYFKGVFPDLPITNTDWFVRLMRHKYWSFPVKGDTSKDYSTLFYDGGKNQHLLLDYLGKNAGACLLSLGKIKTVLDHKDNKLEPKVDMTNYLVIAVNGNGLDADDAKAHKYVYPSEQDIKANIPYAVYTGSSIGAVYTPNEAGTTNYIVFSGSIILNPITDVTAPFSPYMRSKDGYTYEKMWHKERGKSVPKGEKGERIYVRKYWQATTPTDEPTWHEDMDDGFYPLVEDAPKLLEFKYSAVGDSTDKISKVAVIACMLIIGNKCVVETGKDGQVTDFHWQDYKPRTACASDEEYYAQSFTLGINPKIGDKLIGTEYEIQNNISYTMGLDGISGTAIPVKSTDFVSGQVRFMILGPVNTTWDDITRRHPTFFRHTTWTAKTKPILAHVANILLKSFEIKTASDNGHKEKMRDKSDIVYLSDTHEAFVNKKDDLEFKIHSALTAEESAQLGIDSSIKLSNPVYEVGNIAVRDVYSYEQARRAKPEQLYVDSYYREYHKPRILLTSAIQDVNGWVSLFNHYRHEALGKEFFVQGISRNLRGGYAELVLKEVAND